MTKQRFTPAYPAELRERGVRQMFFKPLPHSICHHKPLIVHSNFHFESLNQNSAPMEILIVPGPQSNSGGSGAWAAQAPAGAPSGSVCSIHLSRMRRRSATLRVSIASDSASSASDSSRLGR